MYRCMHGSPPLKWNKALYKNTQKIFGKATGMVHSGSYDLTDAEGGPAGENLFQGSKYYTPNQVVDLWYSEVDDCDWSTSCEKGNGGKVVGHFTAVVWKGAKVTACTYSENKKIAACRFGTGPGTGMSCDTPNMGGCYSSNVFPKVKEMNQCPGGKNG